MITPPVAMAAYAAAAIARCDYNKVGWTAFRFSLPSLFIAFFFVYNPGLLFVDGPAAAIVPTLRCLVATVSMAASTSGWLIKRANLPQRILLFSGAMGALHVNLLTDVLGITALLIVGFWQWMEKRKDRERAASSEKGV